MRELILKMSISVDGFVGDLEGSNTWMYGSCAESKAWAVEQTWNASLHIMGANTFRAMAPFWPTSTMEFASPMNQIPKAVFSSQGEEIFKGLNPSGNWAEAYVASGDLAEEIAALKAQDGKPILAHGGVRFARALVAQGLVDRFVFGVHPVALGKGQPLFSGLAAPMQLKLVSSQAFPGGAAAQIYRPA
ncbi:MAG: dihydrofolate reductase family protein [Hyphomonadaceae bacterium]